MKIVFITFIVAFGISCTGNTKSPNMEDNSEKLIKEALAKSEKLIAEAEAKAKANEAKVLADIEEKRQLDDAKKKKEENEMAAQKALNKKMLTHTDASLDQYNGFYLSERNMEGSFIFVDGVLTFFDHKDWKTTYKNEHYYVKGITEDGYFSVKAKLMKDRKGNVSVKETILKEGIPEMKGGNCTAIVRGRTKFVRCKSFREFMQKKEYYSLEELVSETNSKYGHSQESINKALDRTDFYLCQAFETAPFYGDRITLVDVLDSIVNMP